METHQHVHQTPTSAKTVPLSSHQNSFHKQTALQNEIYVRTLNSSEILDGNDAILKCDFDRHNSLWQINAWYRDDGKIFLPLESLVQSIQQAFSGSSIALQDAFGKQSFFFNLFFLKLNCTFIQMS